MPGPQPKPKVCDCGSPATTRNVARDYVCDRCRAIERAARENRGRYALGLISKVREWRAPQRERHTQNFMEFLDQTPIIAPDSIARLNAMLSDGLQKCVDRIVLPTT